MSTLKELFESYECKQSITLKMLQELEKFTLTYEVKKDHPEAFNTPLLGVHKAYWLPSDADAIFAIFNIDKKIFINAIKQCPAIDKNFNVASNEFNILVIWLIYCIRNTPTLAKTVVYNSQIYLLKLLMYKFFCGKVAQMFQYGAKEDVMKYTIDALTAKSDIKNEETNTWKKLINKHCLMALEPKSIYMDVFDKFSPDLSITKAITDIHTRLCRKIVLIAEAYYDNNKKGLGYGTTTIMIDDAEGGKKLGELAGTIDLVSGRLCTAVLNINEFIDMNYVTVAARLASNLKKDNLLSALNMFSDMATLQVADKTTQEVIYDNKKQPIYTGYVKFITEFLQKSYRRIALQGTNVKSNVAVLQAIKNTYSASRVVDNDILIIKNSFDYFLQRTKFTRQATLVSLRMAMIMYLTMMSFKYQ